MTRTYRLLIVPNETSGHYSLTMYADDWHGATRSGTKLGQRMQLAPDELLHQLSQYASVILEQSAARLGTGPAVGDPDKGSRLRAAQPTA